jgi:hypothetical protein
MTSETIRVFERKIEKIREEEEERKIWIQGRTHVCFGGAERVSAT